MSEAPEFRVELEQLEDFNFAVRFDWEGVPALIVDEPPPLGGARGPNPARLLAASVGSCLSSSLLFCMRKAHLEPTSIRTTVTGGLVRNERGRLRIGGMNVAIDVEAAVEPSGRFGRCTELFEDFCVVTATVRQGMTVAVAVRLNGETVYSAV